ncbi:MAG: hypothetical protein MZV63_72135 [Marinilabiliales bacterium]|nr:hypothetical protein [Marinilabiliales bacterium]
MAAGLQGCKPRSIWPTRAIKVALVEKQIQHRRHDGRAEQGLPHPGLLFLHHHPEDVGGGAPREHLPDDFQRSAIHQRKRRQLSRSGNEETALRDRRATVPAAAPVRWFVPWICRTTTHEFGRSAHRVIYVPFSHGRAPKGCDWILTTVSTAANVIKACTIGCH